MTMRLVRQKNRSSGCGPACVAMLAGVTYEQAIRSIWDGHDYKIDLYTGYSDLRKGLRGLGVRVADRATRSSSFTSAHGVYIYGCQRNKKGDTWHWVVFDGRRARLYDPLKGGYLGSMDALDQEYRPHSRLRVWPKRSRSDR